MIRNSAVWGKSSTYIFPLAIMTGSGSIVTEASAQDQTDVVEITDEFNDPQVRVCPDGKYESGCDRGDISNAVLVDEETPENLSENCLFKTKARCSPTAHGVIRPTAHSHTITWQHMTIQPLDGPHVEMLVMVENEAEFPNNVLVARQTEGWYGLPQVIREDDGMTVIHAPGRSGGTGMGNVDVLLTAHKMGWTTFNVNAYLEEASRLLPKGFELSGSANFDFREMHASVPVKRDGDGGCCATGGVAHIDFGFPRPNWLQVEAITFDEMSPVKSHRIKAIENLVEYDNDF